MPVFGLGTYGIGGNSTPSYEKDAQEITAIQAAIEAGITHIDTAESYASGHTEELVGTAIKNCDRAKLFLVSKVSGENLSYKGIMQAIKGSLQRLQVDYLDLYLMHRCPEINKFQECVKAMNELVAMGLVRHIGLSNTNTAHTRDLQSMSDRPFVVNQVHYNLQFREPETDGLLQYCQRADMFFMAWRPVNKGALNKNGTDITKPGTGLLDEMCKKYDKSPAHISINWLTSQVNVITLAKSANINHLKDNLGAFDWIMDTEDIEKLRKNFPRQEFISDTVPLHNLL